MDITTADLFLILFLVFLEGILSIDNALVIAVMAGVLPKEQQRKALTYGLAGAVVFRLIALGLASKLIHWTWVKFVGGGYLVFIALKHFLAKGGTEKEKSPKAASFWRVVVAIELTDIAFAVDSIMAAVALTSKFWVVFTGGLLGLIMMRFAATLFLKLLRRFPSFEDTAYLLVFVIGVKVTLEGFRFEGLNFHSLSNPESWIFWGIMAACILYGFRPKKQQPSLDQPKGQMNGLHEERE